MADISKIEIQSGTYNIKDSTARTLINSLESNTNNKINSLETNTNNKINNLNAEINDIVSKEIIIISDSYGDGYSAEGMKTSFLTLLNQYFRDSKIKLHTSSHGGDGFATNDFFNQLVAFSTSLSSEVKNNITEIYVVGGYNDSNYNPDQIKGGIDSFMSYMLSNFPNATLYTAFVGLSVKLSDLTQKQNDLYYANVAYTTYYADKYKSIKNACGCLGAHYMVKGDYHPNQNGQNAIYKMLQEYIVTHSYDAYNMLTDTLTMDSKFNDNDTPFIMNMKNGINELVNIYFNISLKSPIQINNGDLITIGTFNTIVGGPVSFSCVAFALGASAPVVGELRIRKSVLEFYVYSGPLSNVTGLFFFSAICNTAPQFLFY